MTLFTFFTRPLRASGRKAPMSQAPNAASTPSDDRLDRLLSAVQTLADKQALLLQSIRPSSPALPPPAGASLNAPVAAAPAGDLRSIVASLFREHQASAAQSAARDAYVRRNLGDLPDAYRKLMPDTADENALAAAEQTVRRQYRDDFRAVRSSVGRPASFRPHLSADDALPERTVGQDLGETAELGGQPPSAAVDYAALSPMQQIALGLRSSVTSRESASSPKPPQAQTITEPSRRTAADEPTDDEPLFVGAD